MNRIEANVCTNDMSILALAHCQYQDQVMSAVNEQMCDVFVY